MEKYLIKRADTEKMNGYISGIGNTGSYSDNLTDTLVNAFDFKSEELAKAMAKFLTANNQKNKEYKAVIIEEKEVK